MTQSAKQEIEVKLRVRDAAEMRRRLRAMGARAVRRVHEMNTLFDTPQATLRKRGRLLRLREETELNDGPRALHRMQKERSFASLPSAPLRAGRMTAGRTRYVLTFKGPGNKSEQQSLTSVLPAARDERDVSYTRYKVREEMEYILGEPRAFLALARQAGMSPSFRYEKFRTSYRVPGAGGVHVEFDETPAGVFLELEGSRRAIDRMARRLGYGPGEYITRSYAALHLEECRRRGVRAGDMVFGTKKK